MALDIKSNNNKIVSSCSDCLATARGRVRIPAVIDNI